MINLIAACDYANAIGYKNELLVKLPDDLKRFRQLTENNFAVFGRKTFESIGHALPNRHNIIVTRNTKYVDPPETYVYNSLNDVIHEYWSYNNSENELFICGGSELYKQALPYADRVYLTIIEHTFEKADTYFPKFSLVDYKVIERVDNKKDEKHPYNFSFVTYEKRINNKLFNILID